MGNVCCGKADVDFPSTTTDNRSDHAVAAVRHKAMQDDPSGHHTNNHGADEDADELEAAHHSTQQMMMSEHQLARKAADDNYWRDPTYRDLRFFRHRGSSSALATSVRHPSTTTDATTRNPSAATATDDYSPGGVPRKHPDLLESARNTSPPSPMDPEHHHHHHDDVRRSGAHEDVFADLMSNDGTDWTTLMPAAAVQPPTAATATPGTKEHHPPTAGGDETSPMHAGGAVAQSASPPVAASSNAGAAAPTSAAPDVMDPLLHHHRHHLHHAHSQQHPQQHADEVVADHDRPYDKKAFGCVGDDVDGCEAAASDRPCPPAENPRDWSQSIDPPSVNFTASVRGRVGAFSDSGVPASGGLTTLSPLGTSAAGATPVLRTASSKKNPSPSSSPPVTLPPLIKPACARGL